MDKIILSFCFLLLSFSGMAQSRQHLYRCFVDGNRNCWKDEIEVLSDKPSLSASEESILIETLYGYIGWCLRDNEKSEARSMLPLFREKIEKSGAEILSLSDKSAYQSALYGFSILLSRGKGITLGPKSIRAADKAIEADPCNPLGYIQKGNIEYNMPRIFGGSVEEGLKYYKQAEILFHKEKTDPYDWQYVHLLCMIRQLLLESDRREEAGIYEGKIRAIVPDFSWKNLN